MNTGPARNGSASEECDLKISPLFMVESSTMPFLLLPQWEMKVNFSCYKLRSPLYSTFLPTEGPRQRGQDVVSASGDATMSQILISPSIPLAVSCSGCLSCFLQHIKDLLSLLATNNTLIHSFSYYLGH